VRFRARLSLIPALMLAVSGCAVMICQAQQQTTAEVTQRNAPLTFSQPGQNCERPVARGTARGDWARNLPDSDDPLLKNLDELCKDVDMSELEIAAYDRTHPPNDGKPQVTDLRKQLCVGPDDLERNQNKEERTSQAPAKWRGRRVNGCCWGIPLGI
jgi:hypothetical protein